MPLSIRSKLTFIYIATISFLLILFSFLIFYIIQKSLYDNIDISLSNSLNTITLEVFRKDIYGKAKEIPEELKQFNNHEDEEDKTISEEFEEEILEVLQPKRQCGQLVLIAEQPEILVRSDNLPECNFPTSDEFLNKVLIKRDSNNPLLLNTVDSYRVVTVFITDNIGNPYLIK